MKTYKVMRQTFGHTRLVYETTRKRDVEKFFNGILHQFVTDKKFSVTRHSIGWFTAEYLGPHQPFTAELYIVSD